MFKRLVFHHKSLFAAILFTTIMMLYAQFILGHFSTCFYVEGAMKSLGLSFGYSTAEVLAFFNARSIEQLICYTHFLKKWDSIFPLLYTAMYVSWIIYLFRNWQYLIFIPVIHMISDWFENYFEISLVNQYLSRGEISDHLVSAGSYFTTTKWILSILTYLILVSGIFKKLKSYWTARRPNT